MRPAAGRILFAGSAVTTEPISVPCAASSAMMFRDPVGLAQSAPAHRHAARRSRSVIQGVKIAGPPRHRKAQLAQVGLPSRLRRPVSARTVGRPGAPRGRGPRARPEAAPLLADEPTAGLDVSVQGDVLNLIAELKRELGFAVDDRHAQSGHDAPCQRSRSPSCISAGWSRPGRHAGRLRRADAPLHRDADPVRAGARPAQAAVASLAIRGEIPSVFRRPSGCEFHTRCPIARRALPRRGTRPTAAMGGGPDGALPFPARDAAGKNWEAFHAPPSTTRGKRHDQMEYQTDVISSRRRARSAPRRC